MKLTLFRPLYTSSSAWVAPYTPSHIQLLKATTSPNLGHGASQSQLAFTLEAGFLVAT